MTHRSASHVARLSVCSQMRLPAWLSPYIPSRRGGSRWAGGDEKKGTRERSEFLKGVYLRRCVWLRVWWSCCAVYQFISCWHMRECVSVCMCACVCAVYTLCCRVSLVGPLIEGKKHLRTFLHITFVQETIRCSANFFQDPLITRNSFRALLVVHRCPGKHSALCKPFS